MRSRLLLIYLFLGAVGLGGLILWTGLRLQIASLSQMQHDLEQQAELVANAFRYPLEERGDEANSPAMQSLLHQYAQDTEGRLTLVDAKYRVLFSSDSRVEVNSVGHYPEFRDGPGGHGYYDVRWDEAYGGKRLFVAVPVISEDGQAVAFVQLSIPMTLVYHRTGQIWLSLGAAGAVLLLCTALASLLLAHQITKPIQSLTTVTEAMAAGDLNHQLQPAGPDEIRRLGQAFNHMAQRVRDTLDRQNAFVADAAHELRSPLTGIRLRLDMLQSHQDPGLTQRYLGQMQREVDHLRRLVDHLMALSTLDAGDNPPASPLDLAPLLYDLADEMGPLVQVAGLRLAVDVPPHLPPVQINADQMRAVIRNLLDNAIKYTPRGGAINVSARAEQRVIISVSDTGIGIPATSLPHIFERFYRVDKARSRQQGGAGLGLALVRSIIEARGGQVQVRSQPGQGSVFTVLLPVTAKEAKAAN